MLGSLSPNCPTQVPGTEPHRSEREQLVEDMLSAIDDEKGQRRRERDKRTRMKQAERRGREARVRSGPVAGLRLVQPVSAFAAAPTELESTRRPRQ
jgi:hypothetical protein